MQDFLFGLNYQTWILTALLVLPLVGVLPVLLAPSARAKHIALVVTILEFLLSAGLWWAFDPTSGAIQFGVVAPWLPQWGINYRVGLDGISLFMVLLSTGPHAAGSARKLEIHHRTRAGILRSHAHPDDGHARGISSRSISSFSTSSGK